jgi:hypothetical protein
MDQRGKDNSNYDAKASFARKPINRLPRDRILIVAEGEVTEPNYFKSLCKELGLTSAHVTICGKECGSAPSSVYKFAVQEIQHNLKDPNSDDFDRVYCVFDRDNHHCYNKTLQTIKNNPEYKVEEKTAEFIAINSVPCFEFWILLHFELTDKPFEHSAALEKKIKTKWSEYGKRKTKDVFPHLKDKMATALKHSKIISKNSISENPSTIVHILVDDLIEQSKR